MKKIYFFIPISVIITAIICFGISHLNEKKLNEQQEQTENTFFESMNTKVDKEKKAVYKMDGFDIHIKKMALHIFAVSMSMQRQFHVPINI